MPVLIVAAAVTQVVAVAFVVLHLVGRDPLTLDLGWLFSFIGSVLGLACGGYLVPTKANRIVGSTKCFAGAALFGGVVLAVLCISAFYV